MSDRKQTPDILGEMLGGGAPASPPSTKEESAPPPSKPKSASQPRRSSAKEPRRSKKTQWEFKVVSFQEHRGWRPRFEDGKELRDWTDGPLLQEFLAAMGDEGWELSTASSGERLFGLSDKHQLYFKRPK